jgi:hypothetical protein
MKPIEIDQSSWHCQIAMFGDKTRVSDCYDLCQYTRAFLGGLFLAVVCFLGIAIVSWGVVDFLIWFGTGIFISFVLPGMPAFIMCIAIGWIAVMIVPHQLWKFVQQRTINCRMQPSQPSIIRRMWESHKQKYCVPVDVIQKKIEGEISS